MLGLKNRVSVIGKRLPKLAGNFYEECSVYSKKRISAAVRELYDSGFAIYCDLEMQTSVNKS